MKKLFLLLIVVVFAAAGCTAGETTVEEDSKIIVAASIVPEAGFVEAVAGDLVEVITVIPAGNSPANYQPTTQEMQALSDADIYFAMNVPTEEANILPKIGDFNEDINVVNLREVVSQEYPLRHMGGHSHEEDEDHDEHEDEDHEETAAVDPHIWLSPKRVMIMVQTIADELSLLDPDNKETYQKNAADYIAELENLDAEIKEIVAEMDNKAFMIYHGAYGYFADDYGLEMIALEKDGKAATAVNMESAIEHAKELNIKAIFYQDEFDDNQAKTVAEEIGGHVEKSTPLNKDYIQGLTDFANALASIG